LGVSPRRVDAIAGVFKAYCSRVGGGPMPTELLDGPEGDGEKLRQRGREFGTVTGVLAAADGSTAWRPRMRTASIASTRSP
jgi:adenylosuccinate synthase